MENNTPMTCPRILSMILAILVLSIGVNATSHAGPWTHQPGHGYAKIWTKYLLGLGYNDGGGKKVDYGSYHEVAVNIYGEIGLPHQMGLSLHWPLLQMFVVKNTRANQKVTYLAVGDPTLMFRWNFLRIKRFVLTAEVGARIPVAKANVATPLYGTTEGNPRFGELRTGTGRFDVHGGFSLGYSWEGIYVAAMLNYAYRSGGYDDDLLWSVEAGFRFKPSWSIRARVTGRHPLPTGNRPRHNSPNGIGNGTSYIGMAAEIEYHLHRHWSLGLSFEGGLAFVRRQSRGPVASFYVATSW